VLKTAAAAQDSAAPAPAAAPSSHHAECCPALPLAGAKALFEATNRGAIHASLLLLYALGGYLVSAGLMPVGVLVSGIGFTFSLMYATQGCVSTLSDLRRAAGAFGRVSASAAAALLLGDAVGVLQSVLLLWAAMHLVCPVPWRQPVPASLGTCLLAT
jgi:hypothetical protein